MSVNLLLQRTTERNYSMALLLAKAHSPVLFSDILLDSQGSSAGKTSPTREHCSKMCAAAAVRHQEK